MLARVPVVIGIEIVAVARMHIRAQVRGGTDVRVRRIERHQQDAEVRDQAKNDEESAHARKSTHSIRGFTTIRGRDVVHGRDSARHATSILDAEGAEAVVLGSSSLADLFWSGLKAGSLTFGGAYTVIPFLQQDAVNRGAWMSNEQFMDGIALAGLLPAPLVIFATFVGYIGGGPWGVVVMTVAVFLPAFVLTLIAHEPLERLVHEPRIKTFLDGLTAGVVGLIGATAVGLLLANVRSVVAGVVFIVVFHRAARDPEP